MNQNNIGKIISIMRKEKHMTQRELADLLYVTDKTVSRWETGVYMPDLSTIPLLAEILGISTYELLTGQRQEKNYTQKNNVESEVRYYYSLSEEQKIVEYLKTFSDLEYKGKFYEKTIQYDHPNPEYSFYSKDIDARFRVRITENNEFKKCMISYKQRMGKVSANEVNTEKEVEVSIVPEEYDNLIFLLEGALKLKLVESYERYRYVFSNADVEIVVDVYPFALAIEIENKSLDKDPKTVILYYLQKLGLSLEDSYKLSWDDKYEELCLEQNIEKYNIVEFGKKMPEYLNFSFHIPNKEL